MALPNWLAGFKSDPESERQRIEALRREDPKLSKIDANRLSAPMREILTEAVERSAGTFFPDQGPLRYTRYDNPDTGQKAFIPSGDPGEWLSRFKAPGFKGGFSPLKTVDGKPRIAKTLKTHVTYS